MTKRLGGYDVNKLKKVYHEHGWPTKDYKKEDCMKALEKVVKEVFGLE